MALRIGSLLTGRLNDKAAAAYHKLADITPTYITPLFRTPLSVARPDETLGI